MKSKIDIDNKIDAYIKENENGDITATQLNEILKEINAALFEFIDTYLSTSCSSLGGESVITKFSKLTEQLTGITNRVAALENAGDETPDVPVEDVIELSGSFSYQKVQNMMGQSYPSTYSTPLVLKKNGVAQSVTFKYTIDECDFATINVDTGVISFSRNNGSTQRSIEVKIYCFFEGKEYFKQTTAVQEAVQAAPADPLIYYADYKYIALGGDPIDISDVTAPSTFTTGTFNYTIPAKENATLTKSNTIVLLCPSSKSLLSCVKQGEILDDITAELNSSVTNVTYDGKSYKMHQFRYTSNIFGSIFAVKFN